MHSTCRPNISIYIINRSLGIGEDFHNVNIKTLIINRLLKIDLANELQDLLQQ